MNKIPRKRNIPPSIWKYEYQFGLARLAIIPAIEFDKYESNQPVNNINPDSTRANPINIGIKVL
ncbi:MAG: hypothetical protein WCP19_13775 [Chloroflexota bacterium]